MRPRVRRDPLVVDMVSCLEGLARAHCGRWPLSAMAFEFGIQHGQTHDAGLPYRNTWPSDQHNRLDANGKGGAAYRRESAERFLTTVEESIAQAIRDAAGHGETILRGLRAYPFEIRNQDSETGVITSRAQEIVLIEWPNGWSTLAANLEPIVERVAPCPTCGRR